MTSSTTPLPIFHEALQERQPMATRLLSQALKARALSNAYLLTGRAVADKWLIAHELAAFLNCLSCNEDEFQSCLSKYKTKSPAGSVDFGALEKAEKLKSQFCQNCLWIAQGEHPQAWLVLAGQGESGKIPVEKARLLTDEINKTSRYMRVVLIPTAEQEYLHPAPANALLKSIEEPQDNALFLLFASSQEQVLPTIVSRTQVLPFVSKASTGFWFSAPPAGADSESLSKQQEKLQSFRSEFIHAFRRRLSSPPHNPTVLKEATESQEISERLRTISDDEEIEAEVLLDLLLAAELEVLKERAADSRQLSLYLLRLADLVEASKAHLNHYVRKNNVLETFAYSLTELRSKYLGDFCLAKN